MISNRSKSYPQGGQIVIPESRRRDKSYTFKRGRREITLHRGASSQLPSVYNPFYANDTTAYRPEVWAAEAVDILYESMLFGATVHRDFSEDIANFGDTVHTRKPAEFEGKRKQNDLDDLEDQDATAAKIDVVLNQRVYVSFVLGDGDRSLSFQNLVDIFLREAIQAQTRVIDQAIGCQAYQFLDNVAGGLETLTKTNSHDYLLDMREVFNDNKVPLDPRWLALASKSETIMQKTELFKSAEKIGDAGTALRNALLGRVAGWNTFLELNTPSVRNATLGGATTMSNNETAGTTSFDVASGAALAVGNYITIAGDNTPLRVTAISTNTITVNRPLRYNVASGAAVQEIESGLINQSSAIAAGDKTAAVANGYPQHWLKEIVVDGTGVPKVGQLVSFSAAGPAPFTPEYGILQVTDLGGGDYSILLDRPLESTIADNAIVNYGPSGDYNFAYQRDAVALVNRPLELPPEGTGARAATGFANNVALRVVLTYDGKKQGLRVTVDGLFGVAKLDDQRGGVLLG